MKKLIATSMAVLIAAPAFAGGQMYEQQTSSFLGWDVLPYVALRGGATYGSLNYGYNGVKENVTQNVYQLRTALGLSLYDKTRVELEGSFFTKGNKNKAFGDIQNVGVSSKNIELMANAYMDLWHFHYIQPFVGLGAGLAFLDIQAANQSKSDTNFSAMGTLGLSISKSAKR